VYIIIIYNLIEVIKQTAYLFLSDKKPWEVCYDSEVHASMNLCLYTCRAVEVSFLQYLYRPANYKVVIYTTGRKN